MGYKRYERYKDSGVDWIGEVPEGWEVSRIKRLPRNEYRSFVDGDWIESPYITENGIRLIQTGNIGIGKYREQGYRYISEETFYKLNCTEIYPNDVLVCRLAEPVGRACLAPKLNEKMITSVDVCILRPKRCYDRRYIVYFLSFKGYLEEVSIVARGSTRQRISRTQLGNVECLVPPLTEQISIANFLDQKTAEIDSLIADKEKMVHLLQEMRQAIISEAVTKGLDKNVKMKDSGVEWIGEIPEHWESFQLKYLCSVNYGLATELEKGKTDGIKIITLSNIDIDGNLHLDEVNYIDINEHEKKKYLLKNGDLLFNWRNGSPDHVGKTAYFDLSGEYLHVSFLLKLRFDNSKCQPKYFQALLSYLRSIDFFGSSKSQVNKTYNQTELRKLLIIVPPLEEQNNIARFIFHKTSHIDSLISDIQTQITKLQEYRQSLISEAVTGKIDVRDFMNSTEGGVQNGCNTC